MAARIVCTGIKQSAQISSKTRAHRFFSTSRTCLVRRVQRGAPEKQYNPEDGRQRGEEEDFFGITSGRGVVTVQNVVTDKNQIYEKFAHLTRSRDAKVSDEKVVDAVFGTIRYDNHNEPKYHGQYEDDSFLDEMEPDRVVRHSTTRTPKPSSTSAYSHEGSSRENVEERFGNLESVEKVAPRRSKAARSENQTATESSYGTAGWTQQLGRADLLSESSTTGNAEAATSPVVSGTPEEVVMPPVENVRSFESQVETETQHRKAKLTPRVRTTNASSNQNLVRTPTSETMGSLKSEEHVAESAVHVGNDRAQDDLLQRHERFKKKTKQKQQQQYTASSETKTVVVHGTAEKLAEDSFDVTAPIENLENIVSEPKPTSRLDGAKEDGANAEEEAPKTAYEFLRGQSPTKGSNDVKLDSKGFHILKSEVRPQIHNLLKSEMVALLRRRILYNDYDIVVLDKPYGLVCHGPAPSVPESCILTSVLPDLAEALATRGMENPKLYTVHRLDRDVTGALLLAKTQQMADTLETLLEERHITKTYWAITRGVPDHNEGVIDIPIAEGSVGTAKRMVLCPRLEPKYDHLVPKFRRTYEAVTRYRVLSSNGHAAYLELVPTTGFRHQLRVHLGFGLRCPILGDHKYSHLRHLAPQKLPGDMLDRLGVRQSKVRDVPLHLHARSLVVPEVLDGRNLIVTAHPPYHFVRNLKRLKLNKK